MSSKPHLQIYAPAKPQCSFNNLKVFHLFSELPLEIRLQIWQHSMEYGRIIRIHLRMRVVMDALLAREGQGRPDTFDEHSPVVQGYQVLSKLLRVNRESREAATSFYRVHVPCWLTKGASRQESLVPGTIYYNPEYDFLEIEQDDKEVVPFFCALKSKYDPRHVGVLNLALDHNQLDRFALVAERLSDNNSAYQETFIKIISQLHEVFLVSIQIVSRQVLGRETGALTIYETTFNRSFPITATALNFDRIGCDPRPIADDLAGLHITSDPRRLYVSWQRFLKELDLDPGQIQYRILLAFTTVGSDNAIFDRESAERWLQREDDIWTGNYHGSGPFSNLNLTRIPPAQLERFRSEDLEIAVRPAIGFWLFRLEAFDQPPEDGGMDARCAKWVLSDHWPELGLLRLPS